MSSRQLIDAYAIPEEQINSANVQLLQEGNSNPGANTAKLNSVDQMGSEPSIQSDIIPQFKKFSSNPSILKKTNSASGFGKYGSQRLGDTKKSTLFNFENSNLITTAVDDEDEDEHSSVDIQFNSHKTTNPADSTNPERRVSSISFDFVGKSTDNFSMNSSINSQGKFIKNVYKEIIRVYESTLVRKIRFYLKSISFSLIANLVLFCILVLFISLSILLVPGYTLPSFSYYNGKLY